MLFYFFLFVVFGDFLKENTNRKVISYHISLFPNQPSIFFFFCICSLLVLLLLCDLFKNLSFPHHSIIFVLSQISFPYMLWSISPCWVFLFLFFFFCLFVCLFVLRSFFLFRTAAAAYGGFQARGQIGDVAAGLCHSHSNVGSESHLQPTPELMAMLAP